jgi:hypothetical protein
VITGRKLYHRLRRVDVHLRINGDRLAFDAPIGAITPDLRESMLAHKTELMAVVAGDYVPAALALVMAVPDAERRNTLAEWFDERVSTSEYCEGLTAGAAQRQAYIDLARRVERMIAMPSAFKVTFQTDSGKGTVDSHSIPRKAHSQ